eukprot:m.92632 g.92632  ORF g.92632 m.92632 type:complete len:374 (+) comp8655_c0_seq2:39-1160(+)
MTEGREDELSLPHKHSSETRMGDLYERIDEGSTFYETVDAVRRNAWWWYKPELDRVQAEAHLQKRGLVQSDFLVRYTSSKGGRYVLSHVEGSSILHALVRVTDTARFTIDHDRTFKDIAQLVEHYQKDSILSHPPLLTIDPDTQYGQKGAVQPAAAAATGQEQPQYGRVGAPSASASAPRYGRVGNGADTTSGPTYGRVPASDVAPDGAVYGKTRILQATPSVEDTVYDEMAILMKPTGAAGPLYANTRVGAQAPIALYGNTRDGQTSLGGNHIYGNQAAIDAEQARSQRVAVPGQDASIDELVSAVERSASLSGAEPWSPDDSYDISGGAEWMPSASYDLACSGSLPQNLKATPSWLTFSGADGDSSDDDLF